MAEGSTPRSTRPLAGHRLVMVAMTINQPRIQRRIRFLESQGLRLTVYAFDRQLYAASNFLDVSTAQIKVLGSMPGGRLTVRRLTLWLKALGYLVGRELMRRKDFIYYSGFDATFADRLLGRGARLYEISDLRFSTGHRGRLSRLLTWMENRLLRRAAIVTVTSDAFIDELEKRVPSVRDKSVVLENKLPAEIAATLRRPIQPAPIGPRIRIGYVGLLRYLDVMLPFIEQVGRRSERYEFHIYGDGYHVDQLLAGCRDWSNVHFYGKYRNPEDLGKVFSSLDLGFAVYDNRDYNVQLALPNKLYEHVFFGTPLLVASGTALARRVAQWGVGYEVDPRQADWAARFLDGLEAQDLMAKKATCAAMPAEQLIADASPLFERMATVLEARGRR